MPTLVFFATFGAAALAEAAFGAAGFFGAAAFLGAAFLASPSTTVASSTASVALAADLRERRVFGFASEAAAGAIPSV